MIERKYVKNFLWSLDNTDNIGKHIISGNLWEPHLIKFIESFLEEGNTCLDVGACFGWHTLFMANKVGNNGEVYAFEPVIENIELINQNIFQNNINNVTIIENAVGHKNMECCIYIEEVKENNSKNIGDTTISYNYELGIEKDMEMINDGFYRGSEYRKIIKKIINCITIDSIDFKKKIDFIKIDVQGFEKMVLEGALNTIKKDRPIIAIEIEDSCMVYFKYSSYELINYIKSLDYYIYFLDFEYPCDHICVPNEKISYFEEKYCKNIFPHTETNNLNNNFNYGIVKKLVF